MSDLVYINIDEIYPHPENPRKDIGDVSELAESIKKNGIMQNLTVIPGHYEAETWTEGGYTLIIGHRRCAASRAAGIKELPCKVVVDMSRKEQISTMLEENMQRNDLTIYEQAQGFQLMLDLGETEESIAQKTGFSRSTVRRRLNIAKLDSEEIKKKEQDDSFQLTLKDLYELEKIKDIDKRNEILKYSNGSMDLRNRARNAAKDEIRAENEKKLVVMLEEKGVKKAPKKAESELYGNKWQTVKEIDLDTPAPENVTWKAKKTDKLYYIRIWGKLKIIKKAEPQKKVKKKAELEREQKENNRKKILAIMKHMDERRHDFILDIISGKATRMKDGQDEMIKDELWKLIIEANACVYKSVCRTFFLEKDSWNCNAEENKKAQEQFDTLNIIQQMLVVLHDAMKSSGSKEIVDFRGYYKEQRAVLLQKCYNILALYGWYYEEEELEILSGSSELYEKEE